MRKITMALFFLFAATAFAQHGFVYPSPDPSRIKVTRDVPFRADLLFDLYRPASDETVPLLIVANIGSRAYRGWGVYQGWGQALAGEGVAAVVYDATPQTARQDFDALLSTLRSRAAEFRLDPSRVVVYSASANVQLGLPLAMDRTRDYIRGAVVYYGDANVSDIRTDLPVLFVRAGLDNTPLNRRIDALIAKVLAANAHWTIENNGAGVHGFDVLDDTEISRELIRRTITFVKSVTRPDVARAYADAGDDAALGALFAREEWSKSAEGYRRRVVEAPNDAEAHRRLGLSLMGLHQNAEALPSFERAWDLGRRGAMDTAYPAARAAARARNVDRAVHWLGIVLATQFGPSLDEIRASEDFANVRESAAFRELLAGVESERAVIAMIGDGRTAEAVKTITAAKSGRLAREDVLVALGYRLLTAGKPAEAVKIFSVATTRYPRSANAWDSLSEASEAAGAKSDAIRYAQKALDLLAADTSLAEPARENIRQASSRRLERLRSRTNSALY